MSVSIEAQLEQLHAQTQTLELRALQAERQCDRYREAFRQILDQRFIDLDSTLSSLLQVLSLSLDVARVGFWTFDETGDAIHCSHQFQLRAPKASTPVMLKRIDYPAYFSAVSQELTLSIDDALSDERTRELARSYLVPLSISSMLDVPVRAFGRYLGILCHEHIGTARTWSQEDRNFATAVATQFALALERDKSKRIQDRLLQRTMFDPETQLPNRYHLENDVAERLQTATAPIAVVVARVDQYKRIVTTFGRQQSVALLREAATRLQARAPSQSMMARTALDEFALVIQPRSSDALAADVANWVGALRAPISVGEDHAYLTLSTGVASSAPDANESAEELIANASLAMASATQSGGARAIEFDATMRHQMESHLALEQDLRRGMAAREFEVHFQPIVDLTSGRCVSAEALLRWRHPQRGLLGPGDFIAIALDCGAILELGRQALRGACEGLARIRAQLQAPSFAVAINMSSPEVLSPTMPELLATELHRVGLFADAVTLEITETAILADLDQASAVLRKAKESGVRISLDDFGTAFSSLTWLHRLPIDTVKIDRGFVEGLPDNPGSMKLVRAIADLSHAFDRTVVAEGIEAGAQLQALRDIGVRYGQGFLFSGAVPAASFTNEWIDALSRVVAAG